jgi:hypothetical protein
MPAGPEYQIGIALIQRRGEWLAVLAADVEEHLEYWLVRHGTARYHVPRDPAARPRNLDTGRHLTDTDLFVLLAGCAYDDVYMVADERLALGFNLREQARIAARFKDPVKRTGVSGATEPEKQPATGNGADPAPTESEQKTNGGEGPPDPPAVKSEEEYGANPEAVKLKLAELNDTYAVIIVGNKTVVLREFISSEGLPTFSPMQPTAFHLWLSNRFVFIDKKAVALSKLWITWPGRRQYEGLVFMPGTTMPQHYNLWKGFAVKPRPGDCSKFLAHLKDNVCSGDKELYRWVLAWFAEIVQRPMEKSGTSLVLRGKPGVGKTKVGQVFGRVLGLHYLLVADPRYITGHFNAHMISLLLLHADEAFWAGDKQAEGKLKDLVTGDRHLVEFKNVEPIPIKNYVHLLVTGNPDWLVPAAMEERRFGVIDVGEAHREDHAYFKAIDAEADNGGVEALLHHLLHLDISGVNLRSIPKTAALLDQKMASLTPEAAWWLDTLTKGRLPWGGNTPNETPATAVYDAYIRHAQAVGERRRSIETKLGLLLRRYVPDSEGMVGFQRRDGHYKRPDGSRINGTIYLFPDLASCRASFATMVGQEIAWPDAPTEWTEGAVEYPTNRQEPD